MKIIAHRCNLDGADPKRENQLVAMHECIDIGYDVEIDVWFARDSRRLYLGHDSPVSPVSWNELADKKEHLWIHCKNHEALCAFAARAEEFNYFWHESDAYTLTSQRHIWVYPGKEYSPNSVIVMPERYKATDELGDLAGVDCYGICTDYPSAFKA